MCLAIAGGASRTQQTANSSICKSLEISKMASWQRKIGHQILSIAKDNWIIIAGISFALWTSYVYWTDRSLPVKVNVMLVSQVDSLGLGEGGLAVTKSDVYVSPVRIKFSAENQNNFKQLRIVNPIWMAFGYTLEAPVDGKGIPINKSNQISPSKFASMVNKTFGNSVKNSELRNGDRRLVDFAFRKELIGIGRVLGNSDITPHQILRSEYILPVPRGKYDFVHIRVMLPTVYDTNDSERTEAIINFNANDSAKNIEPQMSFIQDKKPLPKGKYGAQIQVSSAEIWLDNRHFNTQRLK
jgi:hypothetical protein